MLLFSSVTSQFWLRYLLFPFLLVLTDCFQSLYILLIAQGFHLQSSLAITIACSERHLNIFFFESLRTHFFSAYVFTISHISFYLSGFFFFQNQRISLLFLIVLGYPLGTATFFDHPITCTFYTNSRSASQYALANILDG